MFCTSLRKRPIWAPIVPKLMASQIPRWTEKSLHTYDIAIPVPRRDQQGHQMQMLLLSASDTCSAADGMARIERLYHLDGGRHVGIVFLLDEGDGRDGVIAYMDLQARLLSLSFEVPVLPLSNVLSFESTIFAYQRQLLQPLPVQNPINPAASILPYCTEMPPLSEHSQHIISDVFRSFKGLAMAATTTDGQREVHKWLDEPTAQEAERVIAFWLQEYVADC